ncbi:MFS transporter [Halogeometricum borinquense]|uniref:MFS transporter n=2 Tax=Halogeometricum borinquense TaxID=60847 RepID=A0A482SYU7_9EURY|nr:MFS transporter [Halogeometricum borinquense]RYJ08201.1 MFS transporter [Halogeometricum borinquense]
MPQSKHQQSMGSLRLMRYATLAVTAAIWFLAKFVRYAFPPLFEAFQASYGLSVATVGLVYTGLMTVYALLQFPSGMLSDRFGSVQVITAGSIVAALGSLTLVFDAPAPLFVVAAVLVGAGTGAHKTVSIRVLSRVYPSRTGRVLGIFDTIGSYGGVGASAVVTLFLVVPPIARPLISRLPGEPWRGVFLLAGLFGILLAAAFAWLVPSQLAATDDPNATQDDDGRDPTVFDYLRQFSDLRFSAFILVTIFFSFAYNGAVAFLPLYLSETADFTTTTANLLYSVLFALSIVQIVTGDISDRTGRLPILVVTLVVAAAALVALVVFASAGPLVLGSAVVALAVGSHGFRPVRGVYLVEILPEWIAAGGLGVVRTLLMGAGAVSPAIIGYVADVFNFRIAFVVLAASMAGAAALAAGLLLSERDTSTSVRGM